MKGFLNLVLYIGQRLCEVIHTVSFTMSDIRLFFFLGDLRISNGSLCKVIRETDLARNHCLGYCFLDIVRSHIRVLWNSSVYTGTNFI